MGKQAEDMLYRKETAAKRFFIQISARNRAHLSEKCGHISQNHSIFVTKGQQNDADNRKRVNYNVSIKIHEIG